MPDDDATLARQAWLDRKINSALIYLCTAAVVWIAGTIMSVPNLAAKIDAMSIKIDGTYRADVARRDIDEITRRLDSGDAADRRHDLALDAVRSRVDRIEYVIEREHRIEFRRAGESSPSTATKVTP